MRTRRIRAQKRRTWIARGIAAAICVLGIILMMLLTNQYKLEVEEPTEETIVLEYGETFEIPTLHALYSGTLFHRKGTQVVGAVQGEVNAKQLGTYELTYTFSYKDLTASAKRTIVVKDTTAPEITLVKNKDYVLRPNMTYEEEGFTAVDLHDGDLTDQVERVVDGNQITYTVRDSSGNVAIVCRQIAYTDWEVPEEKVVYLTFDDGPGQYTERLLDILDRYGVKVTFFVTGQHEKYLGMIGEAAKRGHTIALHTFSHRFQDIYAGVEPYFADLKAIRDICEQQTGRKPTILRFPGGTSNGTSRKYAKGIMTTLVQEVTDRGYVYCDWNVDSKDSVGAKTTQAVAQNVIQGLKENHENGKRISIVLQHDVQEYSVEAVGQIIEWGVANGYTFLPLTENSEMIQQKPSN